MTTFVTTAAVVSVSVCGPLLGAKLLASLPVTLMVYGPPGVAVVVDTVSVEVLAEVPLITTEAGLKLQVGAGDPPVTLLHESVTVPV
jgi:hypothetical protein